SAYDQNMGELALAGANDPWTAVAGANITLPRAGRLVVNATTNVVNKSTTATESANVICRVWVGKPDGDAATYLGNGAIETVAPVTDPDLTGTYASMALTVKSEPLAAGTWRVEEHCYRFVGSPAVSSSNSFLTVVATDA
ncbi:MAG TPA: hypothetical protein VF587_11020, partial [Solirubrobacteraceae bacterium]